jgi:hypothetical protein
MSVKLSGKQISHDRTQELLRRRAAHLETSEHRSDLEARVKACERRYGIESRSIHAAIERGELKETHEVCRWIMDYDLLRRTQTPETR